MSRFALQARYLFPVDGPPIAGGVVTVEGERIAAVGQNAADAPLVDLGNVALLPGLVNAHAHLELSDIAAPLGAPNMPLPEWIGHVLAHRRERSEATSPVAEAARLPAEADDAAESLATSATVMGLRECVRFGTTTVADIAQPGWAQDALESARLDVLVLQELIGLGPERVAPLYHAAQEHLARTASSGFDWTPGLSPHAPYSVRMEALEHLVESTPDDTVFAMHLAESREELELLRAASGPFVELLKKLGVWTPDAFERGRRPLDYLRLLSRAPRALVVHGNYLDDEELCYLAEHRARMALVYCPRTHAYFGHAPYPLAKALELGARVALGTDSRASNPDLDLLAEMRRVAQAHPDIPLPDVLRLGTQAGAEALGRELIGTLREGNLANLVAVELPARDDDPHELLLRAAGRARQTWYRGAPCQSE